MPVSECVGVGWKKLVDPLEEVCKLTDTKILQVKEKFGGLRFYIGWQEGFEWVHDLVDTAERMSLSTCEDCGSIEQVSTRGSWLRTLCQNCRDKAK